MPGLLDRYVAREYFGYLTLVLVPEHGMFGAALALLGGGLVALLGFGILLRWKLRRAVDEAPTPEMRKI